LEEAFGTANASSACDHRFSDVAALGIFTRERAVPLGCEDLSAKHRKEVTAIQSVLIGTSVLWAGAIIALFLALVREPTGGDLAGRELTANLFLLGLAAHCLHCSEEYVTRFSERFPSLFSLAPWPDDFYVVFNLIWLGVWIISAIGIKKGNRFAYFPAWFFAIGSVANGIGHPLLSVIADGYFPGLITSPIVGVLGVMLLLRLRGSTRGVGAPASRISQR
jgi:hypothetical protein